MYYECPASGRVYVSCMHLIILEGLKLEFDTYGGQILVYFMLPFLGKRRRERLLFEISETLI